MHLATECFELSPNLLLARKMRHHLVAHVAGAEIGHHPHVLEKTGDRIKGAVGPLPNLQKAGNLTRNLDRDQHQNKVRRVTGGSLSRFSGP